MADKKKTGKNKPKTKAKSKSGLKSGKKTVVRKKSATVRKKASPSSAKKSTSEINKPAKKTNSSGSEDNKKENLRRLLLDQRNRIIREAKEEIAKFISGETRQLVDTALDDGDWSMVDLSEDINLRKLSSHKETLNKIDEALRKVNEGTYGICEDCGSEISEARLKVIPFAIYCIDCKERRERLEEFEKEEEY